MRFGVCTSFENIPALIEAGYDYLEFNFTSFVEMSDEQFEQAKATVEKYNFYAESFNCFFPWNIRLTGSDIDYERITSHILAGMPRAAALGGKICVIGSGGSRKIPDGYNQFAEVLGIAGDIAAEYGITVVVEPLQADETNLINTVEQGIEFVKKVNKPNGGWLAHLHLARANDDRAMPYDEDMPKIEEWANAVFESEYKGNLSLEGSYLPEFAECMHRTRKIIECFNCT